MQNFRPFPPCVLRHAQKPIPTDGQTDRPKNSHGWSDGATDPCTGGKRVFRASERWTDGPTDARRHGKPKNIMRPGPKGRGITNYRILARALTMKLLSGEWHRPCYLEVNIGSVNYIVPSVSNPLPLGQCHECWHRSVSLYVVTRPQWVKPNKWVMVGTSRILSLPRARVAVFMTCSLHVVDYFTNIWPYATLVSWFTIDLSPKNLEQRCCKLFMVTDRIQIDVMCILITHQVRWALVNVSEECIKVRRV